MSERPFAPPEDEASSDTHLTVVVGAWAVAGASAGTLAGATLQLVGQSPSVVPWAVGGLGAAALAGFLAWTVERRMARARPAVADGRGRMSRPLGLWILALPLALLVVALAGMVVIASVRADSLVPGLAFLLAAGGMAWFARPLLASHRLTRAVQVLERGQLDEAQARLVRLAGSAWVDRGSRAQAQLNLGLLSLRRGDLDQAARWYVLPARGKARAFAQTGLALVAAIQGRHESAEDALRRARAAGGGRAIQGEADAVRLLMVLRREGPQAAVVLAERLSGAGAGLLFRGIHAAALHATGDAMGAELVLSGGVGEALRGSGLAGVIEEVREVVDDFC